jgi:hypothetical protein
MSVAGIVAILFFLAIQQKEVQKKLSLSLYQIASGEMLA